MSADDMSLVQEFAEGNSEEAFAELVRRHINLVYSVAWRRLGNAHEAEEVTQAVFIILARKAGSLRPGTILSGWLYQTAQLTAANFQRAKWRRQSREQEAYMQFTEQSESDPSWHRLSPLLEEAMGRLGTDERNAVVLRFFENRTVGEVAAALGLHEAAAQKRVNRATDKLRKFFARRGVQVSTATLLASIGTNAVQAAPAGLISTVASTAVVKSVAGAATLPLIKTTLKIMTWTKIKTTVITAVVLAGVATTTVVVQHQLKAQSPPPTAPSDSLFWERTTWAYAGYQTPLATLKTLLWAMNNGDSDAYLASCAPEVKTRTEAAWRGKSKAELSAEGKRELGAVTGVRIVDQAAVSSNRVVVTIVSEGDGKTNKVVFRKIGDEWKKTQ